MEILKEISESLKIVRKKKPLVHHITNYVTVNDCANIVLALGGSPVMADDINEVSEMVSLASSLVINIGTLNSRTIESMIIAGKKANQLGIPVIFDPVGVGATTFRTEVARKIIEQVNLSVIRGNMSEIKILSGVDVKIKGVDSIASESDGKVIAKEIAKKYNTVIAITGKTDFISDGKSLVLINNGHRILSDVTGTGCMATSLIATYCGAINDPLMSAISGIITMGIVGELAQRQLDTSQGIGTYKMKLFDNIYNLSSETIIKEGRLYYEK